MGCIHERAWMVSHLPLSLSLSPSLSFSLSLSLSLSVSIHLSIPLSGWLSVCLVCLSVCLATYMYVRTLYGTINLKEFQLDVEFCNLHFNDTHQHTHTHTHALPPTTHTCAPMLYLPAQTATLTP